MFTIRIEIDKLYVDDEMIARIVSLLLHQLFNKRETFSSAKH